MLDFGKIKILPKFNMFTIAPKLCEV
jgi:hypothetical protein